MVLSKLIPDKPYTPNYELNKPDENYETQAWHYHLYNKDIIIAVGREWIQENDLVTLPIYLISNNDDKVIEQIGLFEMTHETYYANLETDEDGDKILNINKVGEPIIYNREKLEQLLVSQTVASPVASPVVSPAASPIASALPEQTKEMGDSEYKANPSGAWINKYLNTSHFRIKDVKPDGNCFFYVVRDAMNSVGKKYTIDELRQMLLEYPDLPETYRNERTIIDGFLNEIAINEEKYKVCTEKLKKQTVITKKDKAAYTKTCEEINEQVKMTKGLLEPFIAIKHLDTFEKYKEYVLENKCWAKEWSIQHIENELNIKVIICNQKSYENDRADEVLSCTKSDVTEPEYYILANYINEEHYQLIYFKDTLAFKFNQLPYILRSKIVERCIVANAKSGWKNLVDFKGFEPLATPVKKATPVIKATPAKKTKQVKPVTGNPCTGLTEEECAKKVDDCNYRKGKIRQYCAKKPAKK